MSDVVPEFSRPVQLTQLGSGSFRQQVAATADERERLARRFDLVTLDRLTATVTLCRRDDTILLEAVFEADFAQTCVVTLEPVAGTLAQSFSVLYGPVGEAQAEIDLGAEEIVFEPLTGASIDIGEAVAQELSLALPEFPRDPDAVIDAGAPETADMRFAALASRHDPEQD